MARKLRLEFGGACYHVINRGNYRRNLFSGNGAADSFEDCLFEGAERFRWRLHAFVIMRNHFHLALETPEPNLSAGMKWLQGTWAARFNRYRGEVGRPFQGRFKALHVEPGHALAQVAHYIHLNPIRARVVTIDQLLIYRWSSLRWFASSKRPRCLESGTILAECGGFPDSAEGWQAHAAFLGSLVTGEGKNHAEQLDRLSCGWAIGSDGFQARLARELATKSFAREKFDLLGADRTAVEETRAALWEQRLLWGAHSLGVKLDLLPATKSAECKVQLAALMKMTTSVSNGWLADRLQMGVPGAITQYVRQFRLRGGPQAPSFKAALLRIQS